MLTGGWEILKYDGLVTSAEKESLLWEGWKIKNTKVFFGITCYDELRMIRPGTWFEEVNGTGRGQKENYFLTRSCSQLQ